MMTKPICAHLAGDVCAALGISAKAAAPVLALCRKLVDAGYDSSRPLEVYRGDVLALRIKSIGAAAALEINGEGTGFRPRRRSGTASPMRFFGQEAAE
jgi:hypothetical protein